MKRLLTILSVLTVLGCGAEQKVSPPPTPPYPVPVVSVEPNASIENPLDGTDTPLLAIWRDSPGNRFDTNFPYLRIAVWADGRVVFARDPNVWNHDLLLGQLPESAVTQLTNSIRQTGVFDLKGHCYLVPDAPVDCVMLSFGNSQQMLYWDEVENASYGINFSSKPHHHAFKKTWWEVNLLALSVIPNQATKLDVRFRQPPKDWYLKRMIQSE